MQPLTLLKLTLFACLMALAFLPAEGIGESVDEDDEVGGGVERNSTEKNAEGEKAEDAEEDTKRGDTAGEAEGESDVEGDTEGEDAEGEVTTKDVAERNYTEERDTGEGGLTINITTKGGTGKKPGVDGWLGPYPLQSDELKEDVAERNYTKEGDTGERRLAKNITAKGGTGVDGRLGPYLLQSDELKEDTEKEVTTKDVAERNDTKEGDTGEGGLAKNITAKVVTDKEPGVEGWLGPYLLQSGELEEMVEDKIMLRRMMLSAKREASLLTLGRAMGKLNDLLSNMTLDVPSEVLVVEEEECLGLNYTAGKCTIGMKLPRLQVILPTIIKELAAVENLMDLLDALLPLVTNSCTCEEPVIGSQCPDVATQLKRALVAFC